MTTAKFQSTHPLRGATQPCLHFSDVSEFQSTHPLRGATAQQGRGADTSTDFNPRTPCGVRPCAGAFASPAGLISIHAPLAGCDRWLICVRKRNNIYFNPRTPCGVRQQQKSIPGSIYAFQSTHPLRGATGTWTDDGAWLGISIHAPLAGCDYKSSRTLENADISIHAPLAGCDSRIRHTFCRLLFQSTHPLRGATLGVHTGRTKYRHFNPRTPCGVRRLHYRRGGVFVKFQSTHPLRGATNCSCYGNPRYYDFNPRTPCGVRPCGDVYKCRYRDFNPRTPCGVRRKHILIQAKANLFQSTHPLRGATTAWRATAEFVKFQSTHPLRGATVTRRNADVTRDAFQSTHPLRGATPIDTEANRRAYISIHAPLAGCDKIRLPDALAGNEFQSTHPLRGATAVQQIAHAVDLFDFNPRTPCGVRQ